MFKSILSDFFFSPDFQVSDLSYLECTTQLSTFFFLCLSLQADFPANTNILYVDLPSAELVASSNNENSLPGMVLNTKKRIIYVDHFGRQRRYVFSPGTYQCIFIDLFCKSD